MARQSERAASTRPPGERAPRSFWFDPRFAIGVALVIASTLGVTALVATADRTVAVWAASDDLVPGDRLDADSLEVRQVRLGDSAAHYFAADIMPTDVVALRSVDEGELVPRAATGAAVLVDAAPVVVTVEGGIPRDVDAGAVIDVWAAREEAGEHGPPAVIATEVTVVRLVESSGIVVGGDATGVELLVPRSSLARVLSAIADGDSIAVVPTAPGGGVEVEATTEAPAVPLTPDADADTDTDTATEDER